MGVILVEKVAIVLHGLGANGIDTLFANLSKKWDYEKYEITYLLAVDEDAKQFWEEEVKQNGVKVVHLHDLDKGRLKKWPATLYRALKATPHKCHNPHYTIGAE